MYIYQCTRCRYRYESEKRRSVPFFRGHDDRRHMVESMAPQRCNGQFKRVWTIPNLNGLETRHNGI